MITFRPMLGAQTCHAQHATVLLSVLPPTTTHTREEEIEQTYEVYLRLLDFTNQNLLRKGSKRDAVYIL